MIVVVVCLGQGNPVVAEVVILENNSLTRLVAVMTGHLRDALDAVASRKDWRTSLRTVKVYQVA